MVQYMVWRFYVGLAGATRSPVPVPVDVFATTYMRAWL